MKTPVRIKTTVPLTNMLVTLIRGEKDLPPLDIDDAGIEGTIVEWSPVLRVSPPPKGYQLILLDDGCYADLTEDQYEVVS